MAVNRTYVRYNIQLYTECRKHIARHRRDKIMDSVTKAAMADNINPNKLDEHDDIFEPINEYERIFWEDCRKISKEDIQHLLGSIENGKLGGRPKKEPVQETPEPTKETIIRGSFIPPTEEEVLAYAAEMNNIAGMGGFRCPPGQALLCYAYYDKAGWKNKNGDLVADWKKELKFWARRAEMQKEETTAEQPRRKFRVI